MAAEADSARNEAASSNANAVNVKVLSLFNHCTLRMASRVKGYLFNSYVSDGLFVGRLSRRSTALGD